MTTPAAAKMNYHRKIARLFAKEENGFAIVIGMKSAKGAQQDADNMEKAFQALNFAVLKEIDISLENLRGLIEVASTEYPYNEECPSCKVIAFYFAGHGGCNTDDKKPYLRATGGRLDVEAIISPFYPANAEQLGDMKRLFFFDMCLGKITDHGTRDDDDDEPPDAQPPVLEYSLPAQGNILVAFSGTIGYKVRGDTSLGGFWTRFLHNNIRKNQDIFLVLADTWNETVQYTSTLTEQRGKPMLQGPSVNACMGRLNLTDGLNVNGQASSGRNQQPPAVVHRSSIPVSATARDEPKRHVTVDDDEEVTPHDPLMNKRPKLRDLLNWLSKWAAEWQRIGESLDVESGTLMTLDHNRGLSDANRLSGVFNSWERTVCSPHTFEHLISCLKSINENNAAKVIEERLKDQKVIKEYSTEPDYK